MHKVADESFVFKETAQGKSLWKAQHATLFAGFSQGTHRRFATGHDIDSGNAKAVADAIRSVAGTADIAAASKQA